MKIKHLFVMTVLATTLGSACKNSGEPKTGGGSDSAQQTFDVVNEKFADLQVLRYQVPGFEELSAQQKELAYYLYEAALCGRDMIYDQKYKHNLAVRKTIEAIYASYKGDKNNEDWKKFDTYAKRVWFSNGIHHHYSNIKFVPECSREYFTKLVNGCQESALPYAKTEVMTILGDVIFDPNLDAKIVNQANGIDNVAQSANNFYGDGVTQAMVDKYYDQFKTPSGQEPEWGLNTQVVLENGKIKEKTWKVGGMYTQSIEKIVYWLQKAITVAENPQQKDALEKLVKYYNTGDVHDWDAYNIAWVKDTESRIDVVNGFIEVYLDAIGKKGSFESVVSIKDMEASKRIETISKEAQWFEDNSSIMEEHKKPNVVGVSYKTVNVAGEAGDASPSTPIGVNLPNANWIFI